MSLMVSSFYFWIPNAIKAPDPPHSLEGKISQNNKRGKSRVISKMRQEKIKGSAWQIQVNILFIIIIPSFIKSKSFSFCPSMIKFELKK